MLLPEHKKRILKDEWEILYRTKPESDSQEWEVIEQTLQQSLKIIVLYYSGYLTLSKIKW
ncbi:hypothetical protein D3C81_2124260 [compost metagenome]